MKKIIAIMIVFALLSVCSVNAFALGSNEIGANLITKQGKTALVKEYGSFESAYLNSKNGDTVEIIESVDLGEIKADKNITVTSGEKRSSNIIIGGKIEKSTANPISLKKVKLIGNGNGRLISFENININGEYLSVTGDVNGDSNVNIIDMVNLKKSISQNGEYSVSADIDLDLSQNANDLIVLCNILLGKY